MKNDMKKESKSDKKVHKVMTEFKDHKLKSSSGKPVTNRKMALAIALNEAKHTGKKRK